MENLKLLAKQTESLTTDQVLDVFIEIGQQGDIAIFKNDGLRDNAIFSIIILSGDNKFDSIRFDGNSLSTTLMNAVRKYVELNE